ncbi:MAG: Lrp/AsnC family transcriptional regulator [Candidatus Helarchaeota archaeon]
MRNFVNLDTIDKRIIELLIKNSRISIRTISKKLKVGVSTASRRIKNLEKKGVIKQYTTILDYSKLGKLFLLCCFIQIKSGADIEKLAKNLTLLIEIQNICYIAGDFELSIIANCEDQEAATKFISKLSRIPEINRVVPHTIFKQFK